MSRRSGRGWIRQGKTSPRRLGDEGKTIEADETYIDKRDKRGMVGVYQHYGEAHLHRYLAEFDCRYNRRTALGVGDAERAADLLRGALGKRLTYRRIGEARYA